MQRRSRECIREHNARAELCCCLVTFKTIAFFDLLVAVDVVTRLKLHFKKMMQALDARDQHAVRPWPVKRRLLENLKDETITRAPNKVEARVGKR